ncbi:MAG: hypothetical protein MZV65_53715 [Chromatiales bacterium]|nr:hypothetical protein [Chromatiales bacterium]
MRVHALLRRSRLSEAAAGRGHRRSERLAADARGARRRSSCRVAATCCDIVAELARQRHRASSATDIDPLGERPVVLDLLALTRALAHLARPAGVARRCCARRGAG